MPKLNLFSQVIILVISASFIILFTVFGGKDGSKLLLSSSSSQKTNNSDSPAITILPVETLKINLINSYQINHTYTGVVVNRRTTNIGFERAGKLINLAVDLGDEFQIGDILASLDIEQLIAKQKELLAEKQQVNAVLKELKAGPRQETITSAESTVESLRFQLELAKMKNQRRQELYKFGAISREEFDESTTQVNTLQARLNEAQSQLEELLAGTRPEQIEAQTALLQQLDAKLASLAIEIEQSSLKAPFSGKVADRLVDEGAVVSVGQSILVLVEDHSLEAHIGIPINYKNQIPIGSNQQLQIGSKDYQAKVLATLPQLDLATRTLTVVLSLDQSAVADVRAGEIAHLKLTQTINDSGYWLPITALVKGVRGLWSCYVIVQSDGIGEDSEQVFQVEQREVEVLNVQSDSVFVRGTLKDGDQVIVNGNQRLVPGQLVRPLEINHE